MKEVSRWDAMSGTWAELSVQQRLNLLKHLKVNENELIGNIDIVKISNITKWAKLPIPLRTFLDNCFSGKKGKFGTPEPSPIHYARSIPTPPKRQRMSTENLRKRSALLYLKKADSDMT